MDTLQKLRVKAAVWERIGESHPSFRDAELVDILRTAVDELARLRAALEPFASFANLIDDDPAARPTGDLCPLTLDYNRINDGRIASLGDCRRARTALEPKR